MGSVLGGRDPGAPQGSWFLSSALHVEKGAARARAPGTADSKLTALRGEHIWSD